MSPDRGDAGPVGAVLTGGSSMRMGRDKALVHVDGVAMARRVADALRAGGCSDVVAVGGVSGGLGALDLDVVDDRYQGAGPVGGVLTTLEWLAHAADRQVQGESSSSVLATTSATNTHVFVAACDLAMLDGPTVASIIDAGRQAPHRDVVVAVTDRVEPMLALWNLAATARVAALFHAGTRALYQVIEAMSVAEVRVSARAVTNVNTPDQLARVSAPVGSKRDETTHQRR